MTMAGFIHFVMRLDKDTFFRLQWSYISTPLPSAHKAFFFLSTNQPIYLHSIPIERPEKPYSTDKSIQVTSNEQAHNNNNKHALIPSQPTDRKLFLTNIHSHISPRPSNVSLNSSSHLNTFFIRYM